MISKWAYHDASFLETGGVSWAASWARESLRRRSRCEFHRLRMVLTLREGSEPRHDVGVEGGVTRGPTPATTPAAAADAVPGTELARGGNTSGAPSVRACSLKLRRRTRGCRNDAVRSPSLRSGRGLSAVHELRRRRRFSLLYFIILQAPRLQQGLGSSTTRQSSAGPRGGHHWASIVSGARARGARPGMARQLPARLLLLPAAHLHHATTPAAPARARPPFLQSGRRRLHHTASHSRGRRRSHPRPIF